jgi:site-specific recombinase XerD
MSEVKTVHIPSFPALVQQFFTDYLLAQRAVSPNTIASYRDARLLFLEFAHERLGKWPTELTLADLEPDLILAFLDDLERRRNNSVRRRNLRLTALRAFLKFAGRRDVASLLNVERALGVPMKRFERPLLGFLSREEMFAVIGQPGTAWTSQRDHLLLTMLYNIGRASRRSSPMSYRTRLPVCICTAKAASSAPYRCGSLPPRKFALGCGAIRRSRGRRRCCPTGTAVR